MTNYKRILPVLALAALVAVPAGLALAQTGDKAGRKAAPAREQTISPENRAALAALWEPFAQKIGPLKDQMWGKNLEYRALVANPNTKPADVKALVDEMVVLRGKMRAEFFTFFGEAKAKGLTLPYGGLGMGRFERHLGYDDFDGPGFHNGAGFHGGPGFHDGSGFYMMGGGDMPCKAYDRNYGPGWHGDPGRHRRGDRNF